MRRTVLWILGIAGGLTAAVLIAVAVAVATIDVKTLVAPVTARVKAETGRDLAFNGPIDVAVSLEPSIRARDVTLGNAPWGTAPQMIRAKEVDVKVGLLPLIRRRFEVVEVVLVEPEIALERDSTGRANWQFDTGGATKPAAPPQAQGSPGEAAAMGALSLGNLSIVGGTLTFRDGASAATTRVAIERLSVRSRAGNAPIAAQFKGTIDDVPVSLAGDLGPLDALREGRWPYPVAVQGDVAGKPAKVSTKIAVADHATILDALDVAWGALAIKGDLRIVRDGARSRYEFSLAAPSWTVGDAAAVAAALPGGAGRPAAEAKPAETSRYLVSDRPLALDAIRTLDLHGRFAIGELALGPATTLHAVHIAADGGDGKLDVTTFDAQAYGGTLKGTAAIEVSGQGAPSVRLRIDGRDLDLAALLEAIGEKREVRGGKTSLEIDVVTRGRSLHEWAAAATGQVLVTIGPATLVNTRLDLNDVFDTLSSSVNPWRGRDPSTELVCAVIRLPFKDGIAQVDRSVAMQTQKVGVSASGTLDMRDERLDFTLHPRVNAGIPIDIPQMAELVRFAGPIAHPTVKVDAVASAAAIAKIGAAIGTAGLSMIGTSLLEKAADGGPPCEVALGRAAPAKPAATPAGSAAAAEPSATPGKRESLPADIGKALGKLFGSK